VPSPEQSSVVYVVAEKTTVPSEGKSAPGPSAQELAL